MIKTCFPWMYNINLLLACKLTKSTLIHQVLLPKYTVIHDLIEACVYYKIYNSSLMQLEAGLYFASKNVRYI